MSQLSFEDFTKWVESLDLEVQFRIGVKLSDLVDDKNKIWNMFSSGLSPECALDKLLTEV